MIFLSRIAARCWLVPLCGAVGFLVWVQAVRLQRADYVSALPGQAESFGLFAANSATGYPHGQRELILPDRNEDSFHWIAQTQQMFAENTWRVRRVDYDNAPFGRVVNAASPYRWWLGLVAWFDHIFSSRPIGLSVERAALLADPVMQGLLLIAGASLVAWQFGRGSAALLAMGLVATFPLAAEFAPGLPGPHGFAVAVVILSVLTLIAGLQAVDASAAVASGSLARRWFFIAGVLGGGGLWISVATSVPVIIGIGIGALMAAMVARQGTPVGAGALPPWRCWSLGGGVAVLAGYLTENFPDRLGGWRLDLIHPLYGLAWWGFGELLARAVTCIQRVGTPFRSRDALVPMLAAIAVAAVPFTMWKMNSSGFLARDLNWLKLTHLADGVGASSFGAWLARDGFTPTVIATLLPLIVAGAAVALILAGRPQEVARRAALALVMGPVMVAVGFAWQELSWWSVLDGLLLVLLVTMSATRSPRSWRPTSWLWVGAAGIFMIPGVVQLWPHSVGGRQPVLTATEAEMLIERDLAHWLARHSRYEREVVFAPPSETTTLIFHGGLQGIGTYSLDNDAAVEATLKIAGAGSLPEARLLLEGRGVRYLVLPSWDAFFEDYARLYQARNAARWNDYFILALRDWHLPPWLRALPYETPTIGGLGRQTVQVFEVVADQSPAVAAGRLTECLIAIGETEQAVRSVEGLRHFPGDVGALAAEAQAMAAAGDAAGFDRAVASLLLRLREGGARYLPWDRRVSVAIVLARAKQTVLAREQVQACVAAFDEAKACSLAAGSLYNLLGLARVYHLEIADGPARARSLELLPAEMRARLE